MQHRIAAIISAGALCFLPALAIAHVDLVSGPGFANTTQEITFGVGHGCAGADTYRIKVDIPASVTSVRPVTGVFGKASIGKDAAGSVTSVTWQKADSDTLDSDEEYYELKLRIKVPDQPFTLLHFPVRQTCRASDGTITDVDWIAEIEGGEEEPAPALVVLPARRSGWNKFSVPRAISNLSVFFADAQIVWQGKAAYSANPLTTELIQTTAGVTALAALRASDEIWVRY